MIRHRAVGLWLLACLAASQAVAAAGLDAVQVGERLYLEGRLPDGAPLRGDRGGSIATGAAAACVSCHRRSGLGTAEGNSRIPPITARYLFWSSGAAHARRSTAAGPAASGVADDAYDDATVAAAIRSGVGRGGRILSPLMPRYQLDAAAMAALLSYMKSLPTTPSPGISDSTIDIATIVTPEADPVARDGMLAVLEQFVADKNAFQRGGGKPLRSGEPIEYRVTRAWRLHVWTLAGPSATWESQLRARLRTEPVFAVLAGIGGATWAPVHHFCETQRLPCLFPNVKAPVDAEGDFYSIYLSKGLLLDADLIAARVAGEASLQRLVQLSDGADGVGAAVDRLRRLAPATLQSVVRSVPHGDPAALAAALAEVRPGDALVIWLDAGDLALLQTSPPPASLVLISGTLAGLERSPLTPEWRHVAELTYPVDLPAARAVRMNYPLRWFQIRHVAVVDEKVQADTYLACGIVSEALNEMLDSFMRDFLVERIETMVSHRQLTAYYPRLGLGVGQRFASKGGYWVRFTNDSGPAVAATSDWIVP